MSTSTASLVEVAMLRDHTASGQIYKQGLVLRVTPECAASWVAAGAARLVEPPPAVTPAPVSAPSS